MNYNSVSVSKNRKIFSKKEKKQTMIKRIITFAVCLAVCLSCIAIGVMNSKANDSSAVDTANGAINGVGEGTIDTISTDGATTSLLLDKGNGLYELDGDITVTKANAANHATYQALKALLEEPVRADGQYPSAKSNAVVLDCKGNTITTDMSLFAAIGNCTIKNLNIESVNENGIAISDSDYQSFSATEKTFGVLACIAYYPTSLENVIVDVDLSFTGVASVAGAAYNTAGLVAQGILTTAINCENHGDIYVAPASSNGAGALQTGGLFGFIGRPAAGEFHATNCVNTGNLTSIHPSGFASNGTTMIAGISSVSWGVFDAYVNCLNTGDITYEHNTGAYGRAGGMVANDFALHLTECINLGDIKATFNISGSAPAYTTLRIGGLDGTGVYNSNYISCINAGDITVTNKGTAALTPTVGGIFPWRQNGNSVITDCVNVGTIQNMGTITGGLTPFNNYNQVKFVNCYTVVAASGEFAPAYNNSVANTDWFYITVPEIVDTFVANAKANAVNNATALIAVVLAAAEYDATYAYNTDDGMVIDLADLFTVTATGNSTFTANVAKNFYNDVAAIAGNVEFGAIITVQKYVNKISEFTHDAFDAYLAANKTTNAKLANIGVLYMTTGTMTLEADDFANGVNIALKNAYDITYAARAFIKVGNGVYVYSK